MFLLICILLFAFICIRLLMGNRKIRFFLLRNKAKDKESAQEIFHRLEQERIDLDHTISSALAANAPFNKMIALRHKVDDYDDILHFLADKAGLNFDDTEVGRYLRHVTEEIVRKNRELEEHLYRLKNDKEYQDEVVSSYKAEMMNDIMNN